MAAQAYSAPFPAFEGGDAFQDLAELIRSPRPPVALVGAGASVESGYPPWPALLERLRDAAAGRADFNWRKSLEDMNDAPWTAEVFARALPKGGLRRLIRNEFSSRGMLAEPHRMLAKMPFRHFLTTNYDPSIEEALGAANREFDAVSWTDSKPLSDFLIDLTNPLARCRVVYLHGRFNSPEQDIVLTESAYVGRYIASDDARRKLMAIFITHPVVFIGFSMNDPDLANLMREVTARLRTEKPCHYALMGYLGAGDREATRSRMEGKFGVRPVFFSRTPVEEGGSEFSNLLILLHALAGTRPSKAVLKAKKAVVAHDPDDPNRGRFGGVPIVRGRQLRIAPKKERKGYLNFLLIVEPLANANPLEGEVIFHLHPSFSDDVVRVPVRKGQAVLEQWAYGAFTVGAIADGGETRLELNLATESHLPDWFRQA
jgi:hypothetical protein